MLTAAEGRAVPGLVSGRGESRTSDGTHQKPSWGGEVAGARESGGKPAVLEDGMAVVERRTTATTRRVPPQRGQVRTSVWKVRLSIGRRCVPANKDPRTVSSRATWIEWISNESRTLATASPVQPDLSRMTASPDVEQMP